MRRSIIATIAALAAAAVLAGAADAKASERRVALIIGNSAYQHAPPLANPRNDAEAIAQAFKRLDFEVVEGYDLDNIHMRDTIHTFATSLAKADVAAFFYAGHGMQVDGRNFLIPVDAELQHEADLAFNAIDASLVIDQMMRESKVKLIMLDACRDNPLAQSLASRMPPTRSAAVGRGLAKIENVQGTLIAFATEPGNVAYDGSGAHSPFTEALLEHVETPATEINVVMTRVRGEVFRSTREKQLPWVNVSLTDEFYLNGRPDAQSDPAVAAATPSGGETASAPAPTDTRSPSLAAQQWEIEKALWDTVVAGGSAAEYRAYLSQYPDGRFAGIAQARIARLEAERTAPEPPAATGGAGSIAVATAPTDEAVDTAASSKRSHPASDAPTQPLAVAGRASSESDRPVTVGDDRANPLQTAAIDPEAAEGTLGLSRFARREIQRRLTLLGHDTRGVDGLFGPNTRAAIESWQAANALVATGFLDSSQHARLLDDSEDEYRRYLAAAERERREREEAARERQRVAAARAAAERRKRAASAPSRSRPKTTATARPRAAAQAQEQPEQRKRKRIETIKIADKVFIKKIPGEPPPDW